MNYKAGNDEDMPLELVRVRTSCKDLHVTDTVMRIVPGEHQLTKNFFGNNWNPEEYVDEDGNLTIAFRVVGKAGMMRSFITCITEAIFQLPCVTIIQRMMNGDHYCFPTMNPHRTWLKTS